MATSVPPIPSDTPANSPPSQDSQNPPQDSSFQQTQPTNPPQDQHTETPEDRYTRLLEATLREQNQRIQALNSDLQAVRQAPPAAPPQASPVAADPTAFFNNPQGELERFRAQINADLQRTVAPLLDLAKGLRGEGTPYGNVKAQFQNDARYSHLLSDPKIAVAVDKIMENQQPSPEMMRQAIIQAAGMKASGELDVALVSSGIDITRYNTPASAPPSPAPVSNIPPHMRPTAPAAPSYQPPAPSTPPLTELEKRLARERKMTDEQYIQWRDLPPSDVATSNIGRSAK